jgi:hypothetical protein
VRHQHHFREGRSDGLDGGRRRGRRGLILFLVGFLFIVCVGHSRIPIRNCGYTVDIYYWNECEVAFSYHTFTMVARNAAPRGIFTYCGPTVTFVGDARRTGTRCFGERCTMSYGEKRLDTFHRFKVSLYQVLATSVLKRCNALYRNHSTYFSSGEHRGQLVCCH